MKNFILNMPTTIYFGKGMIRNLGKRIVNHGNKVMIVYGMGSVKRNGILDEIMKEIQGYQLTFYEFGGIEGNPKLKRIREGIEFGKNRGVNFILAVGGGSVIDSAKAIAVGIVNDRDIWDFYENGGKITKALPIGAVLTIAATGSEMNGNSVITNEKTKQKLAIHSKNIIPKFAVLDPTYTFSVTPYYTASGISDIMAHVFEQYFAPEKDNYITDKLSEAILDVCIKYGPIAYKDGENYEARSNIMWASTLALNSLLSMGKSTDWSSHKIAHELSAHYDITHGVTLSIIFPAWMKYIYDDTTKWKFEDFAQNVWKLDEKIDPKESINKLVEFFKKLNLPTTLKEVDVGSEKFEVMAKNIEKVYGHLGTFKKLDYQDVINIYNLALE